MKRANLFDAEFEYDADDPDGYHAGMARVGAAAGGTDLQVKLFEIPPGQSVCPYHYEYVEEWLIVLTGEVVVRVPEGDASLRRGDLVRFDPGPAGAHKVTNRGEATATALMFSSSQEPSVAVYPDSDKIGVWPGNPDDHVILHRSDGHVGYYEGER